MGSTTPDPIHAALTALLTQDPGLPQLNPTPAFWQSPNHPLSTTQSPSLPPSASIIIIGSGITGCSVARSLLTSTPSSTSIVLLEARTLTSGATGRNGGHLTSSAVGDYPELVRMFGREMARKIARFTFANVERVYAVAEEMGEEGWRVSEARKVEGVGVFLDESIEGFKAGLDLFEEENPELKGKYRVLSSEETLEKYSIPNTTGSEIGPAGAIWPYRLITHIFADLIAKYPERFSVETSSPVTSVAYSNSNSLYTLTTPRGTITSAQVVHCTNGHASHLLPALRGALFPLRGNMSVQKIPAGFPNVGASRSWSVHHLPRPDLETGALAVGLYYMTQNANSGDLFLGGEKEVLEELLCADDSRVGVNSSKNLREFLPAFFEKKADWGWASEEQRVKALWSGVMGFTADGMPLVGKVPGVVSQREGEGEFIAAGFNGYGMANAWLCGEAVAGMVCGKEEKGEGVPEAYLLTNERVQGLKPSVAMKRLFGAE